MDPTDDPSATGDFDVVRTDDGSLTLRNRRFGETYRSSRGAHREARHVFLDGSGVGARLAAGRSASVLEVGLGASTNLALTAAAALASGAELRYEAWEPDPLPAAAWRALDLGAIAPEPFLTAWFADREAWGDLQPGAVRTFAWAGVRITVIVAPIAWAADPGRGLGGGAVDAVYLDPFSPATNPDAWAPAVLHALARRLAPGGRLVTYTVAGAVRRGLGAAGLTVARVPGPLGGKREVLRAVRPGMAAPEDVPVDGGARAGRSG